MTAMWVRDTSKPCVRWGIPFRSGLEAMAAGMLDELGVEWAYERQTEYSHKYLPDFTIDEAEPYLQLPKWVEIKPAQALYAVRDHFRLRERFDGEHFRPMTAEQMLEVCPELAKPKRLAELDDSPVLVASALGCSSTLSVTMHPDGVTLSRSHPAVNYKGFLKGIENWHRALEYEERNRQYEAMRAARLAEEERLERQRAERLIAHFRAVRANRQAKYDGSCWACGTQRQSHDLLLERINDNWVVICRAHVA
jgi:hypothetical protein